MHIAVFQMFEEPVMLKCGDKNTVIKWAASKLHYYWAQSLGWDLQNLTSSFSETSKETEEHIAELKKELALIDSFEDSLEGNLKLLKAGKDWLIAAMSSIVIEEITDGFEM